MTVEASHHVCLAALGSNEHLYCGAGRYCGIDVTGGGMTGGATVGTIGVLDQDFGKGANHVAVGTRLVGCLALVGCRVDLDSMIQSATCHPAIMTIEIGGVTLDAFAAASHGRKDQLAVDSRVVARGATLGGMDLTCANVWGGGSGVATDTVVG